MRRLLLVGIGLVCLVTIAVVLRPWRGEVGQTTLALPPQPPPQAPKSVQVVPAVAPRSAVLSQRRIIPPPVAITSAPPLAALPAGLDGSKFPAAIRLICGAGDSKDYRNRITAAHQLGPNLAPDEIEPLLWLLRQKFASQADLSPEAFAALKNDVLEALQEKENGIAGTALLALYRLVGKTSEADPAAIGKEALSLARDPASSVQTRVTAVGICGMTSQTAFLPDARVLAQTGEVIPLRLASIAAIGSLGTQQDKELLESLKAATDERLHKAADTALRKLKERVFGS